jgi:HAE1 family hydrophobic/amphiphilic exporter-1
MGDVEVSVNRIEMIVECRGRGRRDGLMRAARRHLAAIPAIESYSVSPERNTLSEYLRFGAQEFQIKVFFERLSDGLDVAAQVRERMARIPQLVDVRANVEAGKPLLAIRYNEELLKRLEVSKQAISDQVKSALRGEAVSIYRRFQKSYDIVVSSPIRYSRRLEQVLALPVQAGRSTLPLSQLIRFESRPSIKEINRESQERFFSVSANLQGGKVAEVSRRAERLLSGIALPAGTRLVVAGEEEERVAAFRSVYQALLLSILLVYMVMAAEFENLIHPLIIMATVPMGLFGAFLALYFFGETINVISGIGMMVAVGIVVDDAIVKIECANQQRALGLPVRQALLAASRLRLRPIILNTFTTVFGVFPMIYMAGVGTELQKPMAVVVAGSLISATFLTLILIPVLYEMVTRDKAAPGR